MMKFNYAILFFVLVCSLHSDLFSQNINTTFRAKMTFPGQTLANIWGYSANGREYALAGAAKGLIIIDVTNPDNPQQIVQIPGPNNLWKEIKTYGHYAYITSEGGQGIQVVDLSNLPSANLNYHYYTGDGVILGQLNKIHALHIDVTKGFLYAYGGDLFGGGAKIFDLKPDPYNPVYVGKYNQLGYIHDGYAENDTMYAGHIYAGYFSVVNMANKAAPELINTQSTPDVFTHNTWLSQDHKTIFSTDEKTNSFLASFDISDPLDIKFLDKIQSNPGSQSIVHNTHIINNYAVTSWYKDGFTIVDVTRPDNLVQVGNYDTYPAAGSGFEGCWGVYPFFPSGTIVASNINAQGTGNGEMFVVTPKYVRACYLEGRLTDAISGAVVQNAAVQITNSGMSESSNQLGLYKMGQLDSGYVTVRITKAGYQDFQTVVALKHGKLTQLDVELFPVGSLTVSGKVIRNFKKKVVAGADVLLLGAQNWTGTTAADGTFSIPGVQPGLYTVAVSHPDYGSAVLYDQRIVSDTSLSFEIFAYGHKDALGPAAERGNQPACETLVYPNPFSVEFQFSWENDLNGPVALRVLNAIGQRIETIAELPETHTISLGKDWLPGVYFIQMVQGDQIRLVEKVLKH